MKIAQLQTHVFADKTANMAQLETSIAAVMPENPDPDHHWGNVQAVALRH